jgi:hypothetical protein
MVDVAGSVSIFEKILKAVKWLYRQYKNNPATHLNGSLESGLEVANRIIALFEAHGVKRTQIYQLLGDKFPEVTPAVDAENLKNHLSGELIKSVSTLFSVRVAWLEGEDGPIYDPLIHYKDLSEFVDFVRKLTMRNSEDHCFFFAYKSANTSDNLYVDDPHIELMFAEPLGEVGGRTILRYFPVYGPFPWGHREARYYLSAFFNAADNTPGLVVKGYSVQSSVIGKIGNGEVLPRQVKVKKTWHPEDYGYPQGYVIGKLSHDDWSDVLRYFHADKALPALKTNVSSN